MFYRNFSFILSVLSIVFFCPNILYGSISSSQSIAESQQAVLKQTQCQYCGEKIYNEKDRSTHLNGHKSATKKRNFICGECGKFFSQAQIIGHKLLYPYHSPFHINYIAPCEICGKKDHKSSKHTHNKIKDGCLKKYFCRECDAYLTAEEHENYHKKNFNSHTVQSMNWQCHVCGFKTLDKKTHKQSHKKQSHEDASNLLYCKDCNAHLADTQIEGHNKKHPDHTPPLVTCSICNISCREELIEQHNAKAHGISKEQYEYVAANQSQQIKASLEQQSSSSSFSSSSYSSAAQQIAASATPRHNIQQNNNKKRSKKRSIGKVYGEQTESSLENGTNVSENESNKRPKNQLDSFVEIAIQFLAPATSSSSSNFELFQSAATAMRIRAEARKKEIKKFLRIDAQKSKKRAEDLVTLDKLKK